MAPIGTFIHMDNLTHCAIRTDGARLCVEVDVAKNLSLTFGLEHRVCHLVGSKKLFMKHFLLTAISAKCKDIIHTLVGLIKLQRWGRHKRGRKGRKSRL